MMVTSCASFGSSSQRQPFTQPAMFQLSGSENSNPFGSKGNAPAESCDDASESRITVVGEFTVFRSTGLPGSLDIENSCGPLNSTMPCGGRVSGTVHQARASADSTQDVSIMVDVGSQRGASARKAKVEVKSV